MTAISPTWQLRWFVGESPLQAEAEIPHQTRNKDLLENWKITGTRKWQPSLIALTKGGYEALRNLLWMFFLNNQLTKKKNFDFSSPICFRFTNWHLTHGEDPHQAEVRNDEGWGTTEWREKKFPAANDERRGATAQRGVGGARYVLWLSVSS